MAAGVGPRPSHVLGQWNILFFTPLSWLSCLSTLLYCLIKMTSKFCLSLLSPFDNFGAFGTMWEHLGAFGSIWKYLGAFGSIWEHVGTFGSIWEHFGKFWTILEYFKAFRSIWEHFGGF